MKGQYKFVAMASALLLIAAGVLFSGHSVSAAADGKITGAVKLDGVAPRQKGIDMSKDPVCSKAHESAPARLETVVVGANGGLENTVLYISEGLSAAVASEVPSKPVEINQKGCMYVPHVVAMNIGQKMQVVTSDPTTHNIHPLPAPGTGNIGWNRSQPPGAPPFEVAWKAEEVSIPVKCNIHPWMHGWITVVKGPYATTDENGSFTINNVPPGSYTVTAWHETYGAQTQKVTVGAGQAAAANFTFKAK